VDFLAGALPQHFLSGTFIVVQKTGAVKAEERRITTVEKQL